MKSTGLKIFPIYVKNKKVSPQNDFIKCTDHPYLMFQCNKTEIKTVNTSVRVLLKL